MVVLRENFVQRFYVNGLLIGREILLNIKMYPFIAQLVNNLSLKVNCQVIEGLDQGSVRACKLSRFSIILNYLYFG